MGYTILILMLVFVDFSTKVWALNVFLDGKSPFDVTEFFNITLVWNRGVSFGMLNGASSFVTRILEYGIPLVILGLVVWLLRTHNRLLKWGISFIIGGAIGNVIDRFRYGAVVDFLDFHCYDYHWYTFNLADAFVCIGAVIVLVGEHTKKRGKNV